MNNAWKGGVIVLIMRNVCMLVRADELGGAHRKDFIFSFYPGTDAIE